jgi:hypothetical protein
MHLMLQIALPSYEHERGGIEQTCTKYRAHVTVDGRKFTGISWASTSDEAALAAARYAY